jgi:hypothetical protein
MGKRSANFLDVIVKPGAKAAVQLLCHLVQIVSDPTELSHHHFQVVVTKKWIQDGSREVGVF